MADLVREACEQLARYMAVAEAELPEPSASPDTGTRGYQAARVAETPEPWNAPAGRALLDAHEGIRRLKARLLFEKNGHPGIRHLGSARNTEVVLQAIPKLAAGLDEDGEVMVARVIEQWINAIRRLPAVDEVRRWRPLPGRACPYCQSWWLKADMDSRPVRIVCFAGFCPGDADGQRPSAVMGMDGNSCPTLAWNDGLVETAPDLEG